ncbi:hypothetical protein ElyMa_002201800 [Elysia marginata]|uniref:MULE transposase domain-containing protein n=1 Tax=Elysia marginata TaxID=1093978 RepID=A0AAV4FT36_9GAST|nr:hypothetical protein ElyMa_002201800 [Elysia marginata]
MSKINPKHEMVICVDMKEEIVCIYSPSMLHHLKDNHDLFANGAFKSCPRQFHQIYTIITISNGQYLPTSFFLLPESSTGTYKGMFQLFHSIYHQTTGLTLDGKSLHRDFEKASHTAE